MRNHIIPAIVAGVVLLILSIATLYGLVALFPGLAEEYYNPIFRAEDDRNWMFYVHPFILSFALAWFWDRFKGKFNGSWIIRGLELGLVYVIVATIPVMWITFSAIDVGASMVLTWIAYGFAQTSIAGWVFAKMNP